MAGMQEDTGSGWVWLRPSSVVLIVVLLSTAIGAIALARQPPIVPPPPKPPPAWGMAGHDAERSGHSLSAPAVGALTLRWWLPIPLGARTPVVDGYGNVYVSQPDGALLALDSAGNTRWCSALQPITDTSCTGPRAVSLQTTPMPGVTPSVLVGSDGYLYVVGASGVLRAYDPSSPHPLWHAFLNLVPADGVAFNRNVGTFYGVVPRPRPDHRPSYAVLAVRWKGQAVPGWRFTPILSSGLTPVSIAPDGTLLVAATAADHGAAALYSLDAGGAERWHVRLALGRPGFAAVESTPRGWIAWVAVAETHRSWVFVVDSTGRVLWRWSTGHALDVEDGITLAQRSITGPSLTATAYVGSDAGVYGFDLARRHAWLFLDTRRARAGAAASPATDVLGNVYVATSAGRVYSLRPGGTTRWRYDTGRDTHGQPVLDPSGNVVLLGRDRDGAAVAEELGAGGTPLSSATAIACAVPDCPTPTPTPEPTPTLTPTVTVPFTPTPTVAATVTLTIPAAGTAPAAVTTTPLAASGTPTVTPTESTITPTPTNTTATDTPIAG